MWYTMNITVITSNLFINLTKGNLMKRPIFSLALGAALLSGTAHAAMQSVQLVNNAYTNQELSVAVKADGTPVVLYKGASGLHYGAYDISTGTFTSEAIGASADYYDFELDSNGNAHVAYLNKTSNYAQVKYKNNVGGSWSSEDIAYQYSSTQHNVLQPWVQVDVNSSNKPYISYNLHPSSNSTVLGYTYANNFGSWNAVTVQSGSNQPGDHAMAVDNNGNVQFAYYTLNPYTFYNEINGSTRETIPNPGTSIFDMDINAGGNPVLLYRNSSSLRLRERTTWGWSTTDLFLMSGFYPAAGVIEVDDDGFYHIASTEGSTVYYITNKSGAWVTETYAINGTVGYYSLDMAVSDDGKAVIAYYSSDPSAGVMLLMDSELSNVVVPEPATMVLMTLAIGALRLVRRKK